LSGDALAALQDFYTERSKELDAFEHLRSTINHGDKSAPLSILTFKEDWNASQFWVKLPTISLIYPTNNQQFTDETAELLARQLLQGSTSDSAIAIISAPTVFIQLQHLLVNH